LEIRKTLVFLEEVRSETGKRLSPPLVKIAVAAIVLNPFAGKDQGDLTLLTEASEFIGNEITSRAVKLLAPMKPESYGKAAIIGLSGEQEHGVAMLTTVFGNVMREAAGGGKAWISSMSKRAAPGATIDIPLAHKDALYVRSHYDGITIMLPDAPLHDEIAVICAYATGGRPRARVGGLRADEIKGQDGLT
jgi:hypothetical protein